jgi:uncharacterized membrane protein
MARRQTDRMIDPVIQGEHVDPANTTSAPVQNPGRQHRSTTIQANVEAVSFQGPIPPPELLREYNEIVPNGADRIVRMAEAQSAHRIQLESTVINGDDKRANWGLFTGYTIGILIIVLSFILIMKGHDVSGTVLGSIDLVGLVSLFVLGRRSRGQELQRREQKNDALTRRRR